MVHNLTILASCKVDLRKIQGYGTVPAGELGKWSNHGSRNTISGFFYYGEESNRAELIRLLVSESVHSPGFPGKYC
jgi:hypothetical protein